MIAIYREVFNLVPPPLRNHAAIALGLMFLNGILELVSVASIFPVMLAATSAPQQNGYLAELQSAWDGLSQTHFVLLLGLALSAIFLLVNLCAALTLWVSSKFCEKVRHHLACQLLQRHISRPYHWFLSKNTTELSKEVLNEVDDVVEHLVFGLALFTSYLISSSFIMLGLLFIEPVVTASTLVVLLIVYRFVYEQFRKQLETIGERRLTANSGRFRSVAEAMNMVKEGRLFRGRDGLATDFEEPSKEYCGTEVSYQLMAELPRYATETLAVVAVMSVLAYLTANNHLAALPLLMLYITAIWRLVPALQSVYRNAVRIQFYRPALQAITEQIKAPQEIGWDLESSENLPLNHSLKLKNASFTYSDSAVPAVVIPELEILRGETVALVGRTGSGKTTLADVLCGYLTPQIGCLEIDGTPLGPQQLASWRTSIGYVPQQTYLLDDTVVKNIAVGVAEEELDMDAIKRAAKSAQLHEFITEELEQGYQTRLGERGARLSGGQKQRLGIARALYHHPQLLVLDEATNAVDALTESELMSALDGIDGSQTVILITHRLNVVRGCSRIFVLSKGRLEAQGTYQEVESFLPTAEN